MSVKSINNLEAILLGATYHDFSHGFSYTTQSNHTTFPDILYLNVYSWGHICDEKLMDKYDCTRLLEEQDWPTGLRTDEVVTFDDFDKAHIDLMY